MIDYYLSATGTTTQEKTESVANMLFNALEERPSKNPLSRLNPAARFAMSKRNAKLKTSIESVCRHVLPILETSFAHQSESPALAEDPELNTAALNVFTETLDEVPQNIHITTPRAGEAWQISRDFKPETASPIKEPPHRTNFFQRLMSKFHHTEKKPQ